jgi:GH35 family endo-1,4-beta-xylanase
MKAKNMALFLCALGTMMSVAEKCLAQTLPSGPRLKDIVTSTRIGTMVSDSMPSSGSVQTTVANREFNSIARPWFANWGGWTSRYSYNMDSVNAWINWGVNNNKATYVNMLVGWNMYEPDWFVNGSFSNTDMTNMMQERIRTVIQSNSNNTKVACWNVVNEALANWDAPDSGSYRPDSQCKWNQLGWEADASGLTGSDLINTQHPVYIRRAFEFARQYTNAKLELRDYSFEFYPNDRRGKAFYQLVRHLINKGTPIDAVGLQCHLYGLENSYYWPAFRELVQKFKALGLEVHVTELDIGANHGEAYDAEKQRIIYYNMIEACRQSGVDAIFIWGMADVTSGWRANERPLPFDGNYNPKPAYYGIQSALQDTQKFMIRARGSAGGERMELRVSDRAVASWYLSRDWVDYCFTDFSRTSNIKVAFTNDGTTNGRNRDVRIDYVRVNGTVRQAETQANTGASSSGEWMYWNGYIDFGSLTGANMVRNHSFDAENYDTSTPSRWTTWAGSNGTDADASYTETTGGSRTNARHLAHWRDRNYEVATNQTITGLSNGTYTLRAWVRGSSHSGGDANMQASNYGGSLMAVNIPATNHYTMIEIRNINVTNGQCTMTFYSRALANQWIHVDDVQLFRQ